MKSYLFAFVALISIVAINSGFFDNGVFGVRIAGADEASAVRSENTDILVRFKDGLQTTRKLEASSFPVRARRYYSHSKVYKVSPLDSDGASMADTLENLRGDPSVEWAEPDYPRTAVEFPDDPLVDEQWHLSNQGQTGGTAGADISAAEAWSISTGSSQLVVAVLDTGIDYGHPDLKGNMWRNSGEDWLDGWTPGFNEIDDDGNGYVDDYYGINVLEDSVAPPIRIWGTQPIDTDGHGTHVAGIIGARGNNALGVSGVNWEVGLMALKFIGPQGGSVSGAIECIEYILDMKEKGVPICAVNASFGGGDYSRFEKEAFASLGDAGILVSAAAGNSASDLDSGATNYPASYDLDNIISVAATTNNDRLAVFSNYGRVGVHLAAPGSEIFSTDVDEGYRLLGGTSMAAPMVSGAIALLNSVRDESDDDIKERLLRGVDKLESLYGRVLTNGRLNVYNSLTVKLEGPFIFSVLPISAAPGAVVTIYGMRFGTRDDESRVLFDGAEASIVDWADGQIRCRVPEGSMDSEIKVYSGGLVSNEVLFSIYSSYKYYLPFAPSSSPWVSYLVLTNFHDFRIDVQVNASKAGAFVLDTFTEWLNPNQILYRNIDEYGLEDMLNILWVESETDIQVGIVVSYSQDGLSDFSFIRAQSP